MKDRIFAGALAASSVLLIPIAVWGVLNQQVQAASISGLDAVQIQEATAERSETVAELPRDSNRCVSAIVVHRCGEEPEIETSEQARYDSQMTVTVNIGGEEQRLTLEDYLCGVLMGEMPAEFPMEALKAQAVAARTYTLRRVEGGGVLSDDSSVCQAFFPLDRAEERYGDQAEAYIEKVRSAVRETDGQVMTYGGDLIAATYFSCSGGRTESAQAVWGSAVPYLVSVDSPGEENARSYESTVTVPMEDFMSILEISAPIVKNVTYTDGGGVDTVTIGGKSFTGVELRSLFGLRSTSFTLEIGENTVTFQVRGYGHRVGLSQYGAKAMAEAGSDYREILTWYYSGAELTDAL